MKKRFIRSLPIHPSEITPKEVFFSRRSFIKAMAVFGAGTFLAACNFDSSYDSPFLEGETEEAERPGEDQLNSYQEITHYNNFYEFSTDKQEVAILAEDFNPSPFEVKVYGLCHRPRTFGIEELLKKFPQEERIYRLRCVEAWSMVIPWNGFPLASLLAQVEPFSSAKFVRFETIYAPEQMPGQKNLFYPWPYQEGLRIDEAMHPLTLLATGIYGELLTPQNGAPIRLVVPWKYGFKSIKTIVKIELVREQPATFWSTIAPHEYGFYANVNPMVNHPRWSQASERRIGEVGRRKTLMFNGYTEEVAHLYVGMDLSKYY